MATSTITLDAGSNTTVVVAKPVSTSGVTSSVMPMASKHQPLAVLVGKAVGAKVEYLGSHLSSTMWSAGGARPITIRIIPSTEKLMAWYTSVGSPLGSGPVEFFALHIDWRSSARSITWQSNDFVIPNKAKVVKGAPNYENASPGALKAKIAAIPVLSSVSKATSSVDNAVDSVITTTMSAVNTVGPWILGGALTAFGFWVAKKAKGRR